MYWLIRIAPYVILIILGAVFLFLAFTITADPFKSLCINLASSSIFVVIAYFFYDFIKSRIDKHDLRAIDQYIKNQISFDVFAVLYTLKKYLHGYNLDTNIITNILDINSYDRNQIASSLSNQTYMGFQIFKEMDDIRQLFHGALQNELFLKYSPKEYVMNLLRITNLLKQVESIFHNEQNYTESAEKTSEYICIKGTDINPNNDPNSFLLLKKTNIKNRFVVYDGGEFDESLRNRLLNRYILKPNVTPILASRIDELNRLLRFWLPDKYYIGKEGKSYRIIKDHFSAFTKSSTKTKKIFVADIVDYNWEQL
jgi:hypothetical protein